MFGKYIEMPAEKWLKQIKNEKLRTLVMERTSKYPGNPWLVCSSIQEALFHSFDWEKTEEGEYYWLNIYNSHIDLKEFESEVVNKRIRQRKWLIRAIVIGTIITASVLIF